MAISLAVQSRRGAYVALALLTLIWGSNWMFMKLALQSANPIVFNVQRTWLATLVLFAVLFVRRGSLLPESWVAVIVTGIFQTTINFAATIDMIAERDPVHARAEQFAINLRREARSTGGVFGVGDDQIELFAFDQPGKLLDDDLPPRLANHIADEK